MFEPFPPEITDAIIDNLHRDKKALAACSLVCKSWLPSARYHLYSEIRLSHRTTRRFADLLISPTSTIAPFVRRLSFAEWDEKPNRPRWLRTEVVHRLQTLRTVQSLCVYGKIWRYMQPDMMATFLSNFSTITDLEIHSASFETPAQIVDILSAFPLIHRLYLSNIQCTNEPQKFAAAPQKIISSRPAKKTVPTSLRNLQLLDICSSTCIFDWLLSNGSLPHLSHVLVSPLPGEVASTAKFLRSLGSSLESLHLNLLETDSDLTRERLCRNIDLTHNPRLRFLTISGCRLYNCVPSSVNWLPAILTPPPSFLQTLELRFSFNSIAELNALAWPGLEAALAQEHFPALKTIRFWVYSTPDLVEMRAYVHGKLPACYARGILDVRIPGG